MICLIFFNLFGFFRNLRKKDKGNGFLKVIFGYQNWDLSFVKTCLNLKIHFTTVARIQIMNNKTRTLEF